MRLRLVCVMKVHQVDSLEAQVGLALFELVVKEFRVHAMDTSGHVLLSDNSFFLKLLYKHRGTLSVISVIWHVAIFGGNEKLIPLDDLFFNKGAHGCANRSLSFLTPVVDSRVDDVDAAALHEQLDCVVHIEVSGIVRLA